MSVSRPVPGQDSLDVVAIQLEYDRSEPYSSRIRRVDDLIDDAAGADLVVLPELWAHGGFDYDTWTDRAEPLDGTFLETMSRAAKRNSIWLHAGSIIERENDTASARLWNTSVVFDPDGEIRATYRKIHRFGFSDGEPRLLTAGTEPVSTGLATAAGAETVVGLSTCYDLRFPELYRELVGAGTEVLVIPAAWPRARVEHWTALGRARAIENQTYVVQCNVAGVDGDVALGGHSQIVAPDGTVVAAAGDSADMISATLELGSLRELRRTFPVLADRRLG
ncbi:carbon-nitrogen family hydrolase [Rhodococcus opacus]|uniref:Apolipoprotein acyltransferase n=1 Tax=Rhodococcus opacus TaxID=37919 RepID=A0A076ES05_RHOOP|nr:carbon-nitrogen family hydrolase [Rhodococcus opacus]AII08022.1 apolipoprotein acyltransferase [Rhodococcus opacus]